MRRRCRRDERGQRRLPSTHPHFKFPFCPWDFLGRTGQWRPRLSGPPALASPPGAEKGPVARSLSSPSSALRLAKEYSIIFVSSGFPGVLSVLLSNHSVGLAWQGPRGKTPLTASSSTAQPAEKPTGQGSACICHFGPDVPPP